MTERLQRPSLGCGCRRRIEVFPDLKLQIANLKPRNIQLHVIKIGCDIQRLVDEVRPALTRSLAQNCGIEGDCAVDIHRSDCDVPHAVVEVQVVKQQLLDLNHRPVRIAEIGIFHGHIGPQLHQIARPREWFRTRGDKLREDRLVVRRLEANVRYPGPLHWHDLRCAGCCRRSIKLHQSYLAAVATQRFRLRADGLSADLIKRSTAQIAAINLDKSAGACEISRRPVDVANRDTDVTDSANHRTIGPRHCCVRTSTGATAGDHSSKDDERAERAASVERHFLTSRLLTAALQTPGRKQALRACLPEK